MITVAKLESCNTNKEYIIMDSGQILREVTFHGDFGLGENGFGMVVDHIVSGNNWEEYVLKQFAS